MDGGFFLHEIIVSSAFCDVLCVCSSALGRRKNIISGLLFEPIMDDCLV